jgi:hypothetical protein
MEDVRSQILAPTFLRGIQTSQVSFPRLLGPVGTCKEVSVAEACVKIVRGCRQGRKVSFIGLPEPKGQSEESTSDTVSPSCLLSAWWGFLSF